MSNVAAYHTGSAKDSRRARGTSTRTMTSVRTGGALGHGIASWATRRDASH